MADMSCGMIRKSLFSDNERQRNERQGMGNCPCREMGQSRPGTSGRPGMPGRPNAPGVQGRPEMPMGPGRPEMPGASVRPGMAGTQGMQMGPEMPGMQGMPMRPGMPGNAGMQMGPGMSGNTGMQMGPERQNRPAAPDMQGSPQGQDRGSLRKQIDEYSFAMDDAHLFLDTHPDSAEAFQHFKNAVSMRRRAAEAYEKQFGPLMAENDTGDTWNWVTEKWPWEGGY